MFAPISAYLHSILPLCTPPLPLHLLVFGYLTFGEATKSILLGNYDEKDLLAVVARWVFSFVIACTFPSMFYSCKTNAFELIFSSVDPYSGKGKIITSIMLYSIVLIGVVYQDIVVLISYLGSITGSCIVYFFPTLLYLAMPATQSALTDGLLVRSLPFCKILCRTDAHLPHFQ